MTNILELAERCEKAAKGDREMDADIWEVFGLSPKYDNSKNNYGNWHRKEKGEYHYSDDSSWGKYQSAPNYTTSLDAAMTLVPEGWNFANLSQSDLKGWWCELRRGHHTSYDATALGSQLENANPAIAVCAAALRAHHALINTTVD